MMHFTELIASQAKTVVVMLSCGIMVESLWQARKILQQRAESICVRLLEEGLFWVASAAVLSMFLYYCAYGEISFHAAFSFLAGLLLWKKICCGIISSWEKRDEAENSGTTARSSIWMRQEKNARRKGVKRKHARRRRHESTPGSIQQEKWPSEDRKGEERF